MSEDDNESPSSLRDKLGATTNTAIEMAARAVIAEQKLTLVTKEDLKGVPVDEIEARAKALQSERQQAADNALKTALEQRGITDVDKFLETLDKGEGGDRGDILRQQFEQTRSQSGVGGAPPKTGQVDISDIEGPTNGPKQLRRYFDAQPS
jgi:hypothetical protein